MTPHRTDPYLLVWLAVRLKGLGELETIAEVHGLPLEQTEQMLAQLAEAELCVYRPVDGVEKYILTPTGRDEGEKALAAELQAAELQATELGQSGIKAVVETAYKEFRQLNPIMLQLCTDWQIISNPPTTSTTNPPATNASVTNPASASAANSTNPAASTTNPPTTDPASPSAFNPPTTNSTNPPTTSPPATNASVTNPASASAANSTNPAASTTNTPTAGPATTAAPPNSTQPNSRRLNDHTDPTYDTAVLARLTKLHQQLIAALTPLSQSLSRYSPYLHRFSTALDRLTAGELDYFTKPIISSYHTVWFELHEDLLATLNLNRAQETANEANANQPH